jgi:hydrogenase nickel incorporation protein HypA/HybF
MHEVALAQGIVELVQDQSRKDGGFRSVRVVHVIIGALSAVMPEALVFGFEVASRGTVAHGARLEVHDVPGEAYCVDCEKRFETRSRVTTCPTCQGAKCMVTGGDAMRVSELEVD